MVEREAARLSASPGKGGQQSTWVQAHERMSGGGEG